jgi:glycosyltransferase involved in cell wall biosynthesis
MKLYYIIYQDFIKERASNVQISNTTNFLYKAGLDINLIFPYKFELPSRYNILSKVNFLFDKKFDNFNKFNILKFSVRFFSFLKKTKDRDHAVYFRHVVLLPVMLFIKIFLPSTKIIYEIHREVNDNFGKYCEKKLIKKGIKVITISESLKTLYLSKYKDLQTDQVKVVHDAVDLEKFDINIDKNDAQHKIGIASDKPIVMYIGSLWVVKGVDILLAAAKKLPEYNFYFIGKEHKDFTKLKEQYKNIDNIFIVGPVDHKQVPTCQKAADLLVIPHPKNDLSQSPMKLFEYLASGVPILSSDLDNIKEILSDDFLFFKPEDVDDLKNKIRFHFDNKEKYISLAQKNIDIAKQYSWQNRSQMIKEFILK